MKRYLISLSLSKVVTLMAAITATTLLGCGGATDPEPTSAEAADARAAAPLAATLLTCDDTMKTRFKPDELTAVVAVKSFQVGDPLVITGAATPYTQTATKPLCGVQLLVGPGNPGPAGAPSTSPGIGIQIWLPAKGSWNQRLHALGGGGFQGSFVGSAGEVQPVATPEEVAQVEGAVSTSTDTGHQDPTGSGSFGMNPDRSINTALWNDFSQRAIHETAIKAKALAVAYYGNAPRYSYWDGGSTGGRQGLKLAQAFPADFDGIVAAYPAINWTRFITAELYPQVVFQRDLAGVALTKAQSDSVSNAAIRACDVVGGKHLGYVPDPSTCRYDPTLDQNVLCTSAGGTNSTSSCVTTAQARAVNKIWYGMTSDGSVPSPAVDNGWAIQVSGKQRWYGLSRGTSLGFLASPDFAFPVSTNQVAISLLDPTIADPSFQNATGNGANGWRSLSYAGLNAAFDAGISMQSQFANINTDDPDLSAYRSRGGKIITIHGLADEVIFPQGTINYYNRVAARMGPSSTLSFYKLYLVPGIGHSSLNGTSNPSANPPAPGHQQIYKALTDWVERAVPPSRINIQSPSASPVLKSQPICPYPQKAIYRGGDSFVASSYVCA